MRTRTGLLLRAEGIRPFLSFDDYDADILDLDCCKIPIALTMAGATIWPPEFIGRNPHTRGDVAVRQRAGDALAFYIIHWRQLMSSVPTLTTSIVMRYSVDLLQHKHVMREYNQGARSSSTCCSPADSRQTEPRHHWSEHIADGLVRR